MEIIEKVMWAVLWLFIGASLGLLTFALININKRSDDGQEQ